VDGGVSPSNNPALQAYMYATLNGYGVRWPSGAEQLLIVSVGTGTDGPEIKDSKVVAIDALKALGGLMDDCASLVETMMQWMSDSPSARQIDRELGTLADDLLGGKPLFHYMRYNVMLTAAGLAGLGVTISGEQMGTLASMDKPANLTLLKEVGEAAADRQVTADHFPPAFDLT
jgi:hypothetical protein